MIARLIVWCAGHRGLVLAVTAGLTLWGVAAMRATPLDALPDLSDVQVVIVTEWPGRSPDLVEDQVTLPLVSALVSAPRVRTVRGTTELGISYVYVVFEDGVDIYWARSRVAESLQGLTSRLPSGVAPTMGPDATGAGWVYEYALVDETGRHDLASLRGIQDWFLRYALASLEGVAEVATIGGFVKQYQVTLDPLRLSAYGVSVVQVVNAIRAANDDVEGRLLEFAGREYTVRGRGRLASIDDLERVALRSDGRGTPVQVRDVADVRLGPDLRRGIAELDGRGEVVGGIVIMRTGQHALDVVDRIRRRLQETAAALPPGVRVVTTYDRSTLVDAAISTLRRALVEEAAAVALVILVFLGRARAALVPLLTLPVAVLGAFIPLAAFGISANIMSLGGLALAIGVLVDAAIVMVENAHRRVSEPAGAVGLGDGGEHREIVRAAVQVGRPLAFSLAIVVISFVPVFLLEAQEGRLFRPLAATKTAAMTFASVLSVTLVPVLMTLLVRARPGRPASTYVSRACAAAYAPVLRFALRHRGAALALNAAVIPLTVPLFAGLGSEFLPPLHEGTLLYMPTVPPGLSTTEATRLLQLQDRLLLGVPEVAQVFGSVGRATTPTDNSPMGMVNTLVQLAPRERWRAGLTVDALVSELDATLQIPGMRNTWTQPIRGRLDMLTTGLKTPVGLKVLGPDLRVVDGIARQAEAVLRDLPATRSVSGERVNQGTFTDIGIDRDALARYGLSVDEVQAVIQSAIGGRTVTEVIEGRERYPVNVRYASGFRDDPAALARVLVRTPAGADLPLGALARIAVTAGPAFVRNEDGRPATYVYVDAATRDLGGYVAQAQRVLAERLTLPPGYTVEWAGDYESQARARARLWRVVPLVLALVFALLCLTFRSATEAAVVMLSVVYATTGGLVLQWALGYPFSVAVWVGYITLCGVAVQTGVVMVIYLREALETRLADGRDPTEQDVLEATLDGSILRLRPKLMTVSVVLASLLPVMWSDGVGSDLMKPIAAPIVGGMVTSTIHVLVITPIVFFAMTRRRLRRGLLTPDLVSRTP